MGMNAWKPRGDGTWIAEVGDGAETLAKDARISFKDAYRLMEEQGYPTYVDSKDGVKKSAVDPGDIVDVNSKEINDQKIELANTKSEIASNSKKIDRNDFLKDSLKKEGDRKMMERNAAFDTSKEAAGDGSNHAGSRLFYGLLAGKKESQAKKDYKEAKKMESQSDSLKKVNKKLKERIR